MVNKLFPLLLLCSCSQTVEPVRVHEEDLLKIKRLFRDVVGEMSTGPSVCERQLTLCKEELKVLGGSKRR